MFTRDRIRTCLAVPGVIAVFLAVVPHFRYQGGGELDAASAEHVRAHPGSMPYTEDYDFGWNTSPLFHYHGEQTLKASGAGVTFRKSGRGHVGWVSWSMLTLAVGIGLVWAAARLKPRPAPKTEVDRVS